MLLFSSLVALPFSATGGGRAPSPLPPPEVVDPGLTRQREDKQFKADELSGFLFELGELDLLDTEWKNSRFRAIVERITVHNDGRLVFTFTNGSEETVMM